MEKTTFLWLFFWFVCFFCFDCFYFFVGFGGFCGCFLLLFLLFLMCFVGFVWFLWLFLLLLMCFVGFVWFWLFGILSAQVVTKKGTCLESKPIPFALKINLSGQKLGTLLGISCFFCVSFTKEWGLTGNKRRGTQPKDI